MSNKNINKKFSKYKLKSSNESMKEHVYQKFTYNHNKTF